MNTPLDQTRLAAAIEQALTPAGTGGLDWWALVIDWSEFLEDRADLATFCGRFGGA